MDLLAFIILTCTSAQREQSRQLSYNVRENNPPRTLLGNIPSDAGIASSNRELVYKFVSIPDKCLDCFTIDQTSGEFLTAKVLDRELMCPYEQTCTLNIQIGVQAAQFFQIINVNVEILDINDDSPTFPEPSAGVALSESAAVGMKLTIPMAMDRDSPRFGTKRYELLTDSNKFSLQKVGDGNIDNLQLVLDDKLDREQKDIYYLQVRALDGGDPPREGILNVNVTVLDVNDNSPQFNSSSYHLYVKENAAIGATVGHVWATDLDVGANGRVTYEFNQKTRTSFGNIFGITRDTGNLYLRDQLDYENRKSYQLIVKATDQGPTPLVAFTTVVVTVEDVNDHAPVIKVNTVGEPNQAELSEQNTPGYYVAHVVITDPDQGISGNYTCDLDYSERFRLRLIYGHEYEIITLLPFDRETEDKYTVTIRCRDHGDPVLSSSQLLTIVITDENDNSPVFIDLPYKAQLTENNYVDAEITRVTATDSDAGKNGLITYKIDRKFQDQVAINNLTGLITAKTVFDYEKTQSLVFEVIARDNGQTRRSATATVQLDILDTNDQSPVFKHSKYNLPAMENQMPGTSIGKVEATDSDSSPYNRVTYSIKGPQTEISAFSINPKTGVVRTKKHLDREEKPTYTFTVIATDSGAPSLSSTTSVLVYVGDQNDNSPIIDFPNPFNDTVRVSAFIPKFYEITRIRAHDDDHAPRLSYSFLQQSDYGVFHVDSHTGTIKLNQEVEISGNQREFSMMVQVQDDGRPPLKTRQKLKIVLDKTITYIPKEVPIEAGLHGLTEQNMLVLIIVSGTALFIIIILSIILVCVKYKQYNYHMADYAYYRAATMDVKNMRLQELVDTMGKLSPEEDDRSNYNTRSWKYTTDTNKTNTNSLRRSRDNFGIVQQQKCDQVLPLGQTDPAQV